MPRRALVLSGGGAKGSFQIGALEELIVNRGLDFEILCGTSVGALNATFLAHAQFYPEDPAQSLDNLKKAFEVLRKLWLEEIKGNDSVFRVRPLKVVGIGLGADSVYDPQPLEQQIARHLQQKALAESRRVLIVQYVSLESGELHSAKSTSREIAKYVLASATMPYYFPPVVVRGQHLADGGLVDITPLGEAFGAGAEEIFVIYTSPFWVERQKFTEGRLGTRVNAFDYLARSVEIMANEIYRTDIEGARRFNVIKEHWEKLTSLLPPENSSVRKLNEALKNLRYVPIMEIVPEKHIIKDALDFSPEGIRKSYEHGKLVARKILEGAGK